MLIVVAPSTISSVGVNQGDWRQKMETMKVNIRKRFDQLQSRNDQLLSQYDQLQSQYDHAIAYLKHKQSKSYTFTEMGQMEFNRLTEENLVALFIFPESF
jgi:hypothetical protein